MGTSSGKELKTVAPFDPNVDTLDGSRPNSANSARTPDRAVIGKNDHSPALNRPSSGGGFNFQMTEGQSRRTLLADCDNECSAVCDFIFVSGAKVASSLEMLVKNKITRIVNCAVTVVDNYFIKDPRFTYLSLNLVDSRVDDLTWFFCEVIKFIEKGRLAGQKTLIHCEKGVSRSCSFAIAYFMWAQGIGWRESFDIVKRGRPICAPNTGFWCNLIELSELLNGHTKTTTLLFRCAHHLAHDTVTPVLKICINQDTRKILMPRTSLLDPRGIFVLRCGTNSQNSRLFVWAGSNSSSNALTEAIRLTHFMINIMSMATGVTIVQQYSETDEFMREIMDDGPFNHKSNSADSIIFDDLYLADPIVVSRQGTPLTKVRSGAVLPDPGLDSSRVGSPDSAMTTPRTGVAGTNLNSIDRVAVSQQQQQQPAQGQSKDVDIFVKVRRSSRENANLALRDSANSSVSAASMETDRIIATINALTAAKSTPSSSGGKHPVNPNSTGAGPSDHRASPTALGKFTGKRNAEEMEIDSPNDNLSPMEDQPSPKYHISNPPSLELSGENFESFRNQSDMNSLNKYVNSCRIGGNSLDSHDSNSPVEHSADSKADFSAKLKSLGVSLQLPTSQVQEQPNSLLSIVDKAAEIRQPESSGPGGAASGGKYEIWTGFHNSATSVGSTTNSTISGKVADSLEPVKELHPDHVDSPHVVTYREKPLLYLATPSDDMQGCDDYVWLPMGVYDDEDLQEEAMLLLICPSGTHYLWVGSTFQVPSMNTPVVKKKVSKDSFDNLSDDDDMDVCGTMSRDDKELLRWAKQVDNSTVSCKNKAVIFSPQSINIQRQREECDPFWTAFYDGM